MNSKDKPANNSSDMFGLDSPDHPTTWRGDPIKDKMKEIRQTTRDTDSAKMVKNKANIDAEGAD
jgi:hypothetical protein